MPPIMVDYFENDKFNLTLLLDYVEIVLSIDKTVDGATHSHVYQMKYCTVEQFMNNGIEYPDRGIENKRLCPNITSDDENYKV